MAPRDDEGRERDIRDVLREATSRRPLDTDSVREAQRLRRTYLWVILNSSEVEFRRALIDLGWDPTSREFEEHVGAWRALRRRRGGTPRDEPPFPPEASSPNAPAS